MQLRAQQSAKVTQMNNDYTVAKAHEQRLSLHKKHVHAVHRRRLFVIFAFIALVIAFASTNILQTRASMDRLTTQVKKQKNKLSAAKEEKSALEIQVNQLNDDEYLQKLVRNKYYFSKDGETIYSTPLDKAPSLTNK